MKFLLKFLLFGVLLVAGTSRPALALDFASSDVPMPVKTSGGVTSVSWAGSYADLLAADALAMCWTTQQDRFASLSFTFGDQYISFLNSMITAAQCVSTCTSRPVLDGVAVCPPVDTWLQSRQDKTCNIDPVTGEQKALNVRLRAPTQTAPYTVPSAATLGITGPAATVDAVRKGARDEIAYAELSLCMARQLREKLDSAQIAFASSENALRLQTIVRERALTAVYKYATVIKTLASTSPARTALNNSWGSYFYLNALAIWGRGNFNSFGTWRAVGKDVESAIELLIESTQDLIEMKLLSAEAQRRFGQHVPELLGTDELGNDIHGGFLAGARVEVLDILYGPEELRPYYMPFPLFRDWFFPSPRHTSPQAILTDMSAPEIGVFLGLARRANALRLQLWHSPSAHVELSRSADLMQYMVETMLRAEDCARGNTSVCSPLPNPATSSEPYETDTLLWKRYGIREKDHILPLAKALAEAAFGPPEESTRASDFWSYRSTATQLAGSVKSNAAYAYPAEQRPFHLLGAHSFLSVPVSGNPATTGTPVTTIGQGDNLLGTLVIDQNFTVRSLGAADRQSARRQMHLLPLEIDPAGDAFSQIGTFTDEFVTEGANHARPIGSVTALALVREALLQLGALPPSSNQRAIYATNTNSLKLIESAIGTRQVVLREGMVTEANDSACSGCVTYRSGFNPSSNSFPVSATITTKSTDPATHISVTGAISNAMTAVLSRTYVSPGLVSGSTIRGLTYTAATNQASTDGYVFRKHSGSWVGATSLGATVILRSGTAPNLHYEHVFTGVLGNYKSSTHTGPMGAVVAFGGYWGQLVERAWDFNGHRWSQPVYDAFGLPRDWAPSADASLVGDHADVSEQQHFLERAARAAQEASSALQQANETLQQEAVDDLALQTSEQRAQDLTKLEVEALCGPKKPCTSSQVRRAVVVPDCYGAVSEMPFCNDVRDTLKRIVGSDTLGVPLEDAVDGALNSRRPAPTFDEYRGGQLQSLLLNQWNAWKAVNDSLATAVGAASAMMADLNAAAVETQVAAAEYASVEADVTAANAALVAQGANIQAQVIQFNNSLSQYENQQQSAASARDLACNDPAHKNAVRAGFSYSGDDLFLVNVPDSPLEVWNGTSTSWSIGPLMAQKERCAMAQQAYTAAKQQWETQLAGGFALLGPLQEQYDALGPQYDAVGARITAAYERKELAQERWTAALIQRDAAVIASNQTVQAAFGQLLATIPPINEAYARSALAASRLAIESHPHQQDIRARFGLRKRFRSYDLWRARALNENARRLAVAARRSLESRYVVDLSELKAPEPFVDAPALWADDVYSSDLKPTSIGLVGPASDGQGVYTNKLVDYVENLRLFLDGYTVQRPTAQVRSDAEVLQFGGPAYEVNTSAMGVNVAYVDSQSLGWMFYCPFWNQWVSNPSSTAFSTGKLSTGLSRVCPNQTAPTHARLAFTLDPWGRPNGSTGNPPPSARYNVRLGALAVNLVGTGIHDCSKALDSAACYAQPFIRYDLRQVGPIWVSNYNQVWRSLDVPSAFIEGAKALAIEEWLDPVTNGFSRADVGNVARAEFAERPIGGSYELILELPPEVRVERIERVQLLYQTRYWVRQQ